MAGSLAGVRVVEFSAAMAGPWIGRFMAYCGAEVIRVESKKRPDVVRLYVPPRDPERTTQPTMSPWFTDWNAGKRFAALDLTHPGAVEISKRLVARCDVVIENYAAGVMQKLGLGYDAIEAVKPDAIVCSSSGYGDDGPCRRYVTWGPNIEALAGIGTLSGFFERPCTMTQFAYPDALSALHGLFAVLCALDHRRRTGRGQRIDLSQFEASVASVGHVLLEQLANGDAPPRLGNRSRQAAPHGCYRCRGEDRWIAIAVRDEREWEALTSALGRPAWTRDPRFANAATRCQHVDALDRQLEAWTAERDAYEAMRHLQQAGVPAGVVQNVEDQYRRDPQLAARDFFEQIDHRTRGRVVANGIPLGLTGTPGRSGTSGAAVGQDNDYVFGEILGMSPEEIRSYVEAGAIEPSDE